MDTRPLWNVTPPIVPDYSNYWRLQDAGARIGQWHDLPLTLHVLQPSRVDGGQALDPGTHGAPGMAQSHNPAALSRAADPCMHHPHTTPALSTHADLLLLLSPFAGGGAAGAK